MIREYTHLNLPKRAVKPLAEAMGGSAAWSKENKFIRRETRVLKNRSAAWSKENNAVI